MHHDDTATRHLVVTKLERAYRDIAASTSKA
jgi:hypothetical protein